MKRLITTPHVALLACSALIFAGLTYSTLDLSTRPAPRHASSHESVNEELPTLSCAFAHGERRAYSIQNHVTIAQTSDRFAGTLSMEVMERTEHETVLRAALTDVTLTQEMSAHAERVDHADLEAMPFIMVVDDTCAITKLGFARTLTHPARQLTTTLLRAQEIVLPATSTSTWVRAQRDGGGIYDAHYTAEPVEHGVHVTRIKNMYEDNTDGQRLGIGLAVISSRATALFETDARAIASVHGEEHVQLSLPGSPPQVISQRFSTLRHDEAFMPIAEFLVDEADFQDAFDLHTAGQAIHEEPIRAELLEVAHLQARERFLAIFVRHGEDGTLTAAKFLARWMRADPARAPLLLDDLRRGHLPAHTHAALFLGFELAGDNASREVLIEAIESAEFDDLNRARAASALADHGTPTARGAEVLRTLAASEDVPMASTVSRLGLGTMAGRAEGSLREELFDHLHTQLEQARSREDIVNAIGPMGNTAHDSFVPDLVTLLDDEEPSVRAHAAEALGKLSPELVRHELVSQLHHEQEPQVIASLLHSITQTDAQATRLDPSDLALATQLLKSPHAGIRGQVIKWLGHFVQDQGVRAVLVTHFHQESDLTLKQLVGQFIPASALR